MLILDRVEAGTNSVRRDGLLGRLAAHWVVRCLAVGAVSSACDYSLLWVTAVVVRLPTPLCAMIGVSVGSTVSFLLNRAISFRDSHNTFGGAALRYAAVIGSLMIVHATAVGLLRDRAHWPILVAKLVADLCILTGGQLLLLRYVVFPRNKTHPAPALAERRAAEVA